MSPESQLLFTKVLSAGLGGLMLFSVLYVTVPTAVRQVADIIRRARKYGLPVIVSLAVFTCGMVLHGGSKGDSTNSPPPLLQMNHPQSGGGNTIVGEGADRHALSDIRFREPMWTGLVSNGLARIEKWFRRGAWEDGQVILFDDDWRFPYGGEHLSSVEIWSQGQIYPSEKSPEPIVSLVTPLSIKPAETEVFCGRTADNSYRVEWRNAHPNRSDGQIADAAIELRRNGDCIVTENGVTTVVPYDVPFAHNGFVQDADWVRANFTNAEEILAVGYRTWAEDQIGYDQLNGLYLFTASFAEDPPEATELYVGDNTVTVTNAGEYVFVLEKGTEYEFGTWPEDVEVEYWAQDDMGEDVPLLMSWWGYWDSYGSWTEDGGWSWLDCPGFYLGDYYPGYCCWLPTLQGSPNVTHLGPEDFPMEFEAVLTDYPENKPQPQFLWGTDDENIRILSPNSRQTLVTADSMPSWCESELFVTAVFDTYILYSELIYHYGYHETPHISLSLTAPETVFLNDDNRADRWYCVEVSISCPVETNATISITHSGSDGAVFASGPTGENGITLANIQMSVSSDGVSSPYRFYFSSPNLGTGTFSAECVNAGDDSERAVKTYKVIEPLRKLVSTEVAPNGGYYNPSRLVYGTNAWLKVGVNGDFSASDVDWRVISGPGRITATNGWTVQVEPTANTGEVIVEAAFGTDSAIQPRFVLPITTVRHIPVRAFVCRSGNQIAATEASIMSKIDYANRIFSQVGVCFDLLSISNNVGTASDWVVHEYDTVVDAFGDKITYLSNQAKSLMNTYTRQDCIELYFVGSITNGNARAFSTSYGIVISQIATDHAVAHELGHRLGLKDCYAYVNTSTNGKIKTVWIENANGEVDDEFMSEPIDWGMERGRGFYERKDSRMSILFQLLLFGADSENSLDIPSHDVLSLIKGATESYLTHHSSVGADFIIHSNQEIFTR